MVQHLLYQNTSNGGSGRKEIYFLQKWLKTSQIWIKKENLHIEERRKFELE